MFSYDTARIDLLPLPFPSHFLNYIESPGQLNMYIKQYLDQNR